MVEISRIVGAYTQKTNEVTRKPRVPEKASQEITDKVEISASAQSAVEKPDAARHAESAKNAPDVRPAVVEEARQNISNGTYNQPEVIRAIAEKVLDDLA